MMSKRSGVSILETLVVLAIIGILLAILLPTVQSARRRTLDLECQNNLRQINLAIAHYAETHKRLPAPCTPGLVGGWTVEVLPFLDQKNLRERITLGVPIAPTPDFLLTQPRILRCPTRGGTGDLSSQIMNPSHFVFVPHDRRQSFNVFDAPVDLSIPWASGPEMTYEAVIRRTGPHNRGFHYSHGFQHGVGFMLDGEDVR